MTIEQKAEEYVSSKLGFNKDFVKEQLEIMHNPNNKFMVDALITETKQAYITGATENGNQWHNVKENPNDLPKDTSSLYLVKVYSWDFSLSHLYKKYGMYIPTVCEWNGEYFMALNKMAYTNARNIKNCIAWCEIPQFEE